MADEVSALEGANTASFPGLNLTERRGLAMFQIVAFSGWAVAVRDAVEAAFGVSPPQEPNTSSGFPSGTILWLGPDRWLITTDRSSQHAEWLARVAASGAAATDLSHARSVIRLAGRSAGLVLEKGCGVDFHPKIFVPGSCAQTVMAHVSVLIHAIDDTPSYDLHVPRSYAQHMWEWLQDAAPVS